MNLEITLLPISQKELPLQELKKDGGREQYRKHLSEIRSESGFLRETSHTIQINYTSGDVSVYVLLEPDLTTFELQETIRKSLDSLIKDFSSIRCRVSRLDHSLQERAVFALSFLKETCDWTPTSFGHRAKKKSDPRRAKLSFETSLSKAVLTELQKRAEFLGRANNEVRSLAELPANELTPKHYRAHVEKFAKAHGLKFEFWDQRELEKKHAGAFLAVSRSFPGGGAGIAHLSYVPKRGRKCPSLALVGKGICFDTGGYNLKAGQSMLGMHGDMTGSAVALALCGYFARQGAPFEVHAYLALAENLISPTAYKPNEVVIASDGTSIEVVDTDAEGRMVLADALALARKSRPSLVIDFATLTYTAVKSLDTRRSAVFSNRDELAAAAVRAGEISGERTWNFPLDRDLRKNLESKIADIRQCSTSDHADHIYAAVFLSHFVGDETPWVHVDLAACENKGGLGLVSTDTTGFGVLWADEFIRQNFAKRT